jgi:hypothetical protein
MNAWNDLVLVLGLSIGGAVGVAITTWVAGLMGFLGDIYKEWHDGRQLAQLVKEKNHKRRAELLAKLIELQRAMQPVPSEEPVIESPGQLVNELAGSCSDSSEKGCNPLTYTI